MKLIVNIIVTILLCSPRIASAACVQGNCSNGYGIDINLDGSKYVGEFKENVRNGKGSMTYPDGTKYVGNWQNDKPHGKGTLFSVGKFEYTGEFANGLRQGEGTLKIVDGITYVGQWLNDVPHGQGILTDQGREEYTGQFEGGRRSGKGEAIYSDGTKYKGQWANDLPNGQGVKTLVDGMQYFGEFKNGLMSGSGTIVMPDGSELKIKWDNPLPLQKGDKLSDSAVKSDENKKDWYMVANTGKTQKLPRQEPQQPVRHMEISLQDLIPEEGTPQRELDQSAVNPDQVAPRVSKVDEAAGKDMVHTEVVSKSPLAEDEKMKSEAVAPAEKQEGTEPQAILPQNSETTTAVKYASISVGANIRYAASLTSEVLRTVPPGYPVIVLERKADWLLVEDYRGRKGWVYASLVTEPNSVIIKVFKGNLRSGPSLKDDVIVQLDHGTTMSVLERSGEWLKVSDSKELTGWLHRKVIWPSEEMNAR